MCGCAVISLAPHHRNGLQSSKVPKRKEGCRGEEGGESSARRATMRREASTISDRTISSDAVEWVESLHSVRQ